MRKRYALFGHPVTHSRSPGLYAEFSAGEVELELIDVGPDAFAPAVRDFAGDGGHGANVTLPYKFEAAAVATALTDRARLAGAVNTLRVDADGVILGDNTDGAGLVADLTRNLGFVPTGKRVLLVGAGGAAYGIAGPLLAAGAAELVVVARRPAESARLAARVGALGRTEGRALGAAGDGYDLVVNATSASLDGKLPDLDAAVFAPGAMAYDLAYGDGGTVFTRWAATHGAVAHDGMGMLREQARESWYVWFGDYPARYLSFSFT